MNTEGMMDCVMRPAGARRVRQKDPQKRMCMQSREMEDCFARNRYGNCSVLRETDYPCGRCPFYKPKEVCEEERKGVYTRLVRLERMDLVFKYGMEEG